MNVGFGKSINHIAIGSEDFILFNLSGFSFVRAVPKFAVAVNNRLIIGQDKIGNSYPIQWNLFFVVPPSLLDSLLNLYFYLCVSVWRIAGRVYTDAFGGATICPICFSSRWGSEIDGVANIANCDYMRSAVNGKIKVAHGHPLSDGACSLMLSFAARPIKTINTVATSFFVNSDKIFTRRGKTFCHLACYLPSLEATAAAVLRAVSRWIPAIKAMGSAMLTVFDVPRIIKLFTAIGACVNHSCPKNKNPRWHWYYCLGSTNPPAGAKNKYIAIWRDVLPRHVNYNMLFPRMERTP